MIIVFNKNKISALRIFEQIQILNNQLLSVDTEISFLHDNSPDHEVSWLKFLSGKYREEREKLLIKMRNL